MFSTTFPPICNSEVIWKTPNSRCDSGCQVTDHFCTSRGFTVDISVFYVLSCYTLPTVIPFALMWEALSGSQFGGDIVLIRRESVSGAEYIFCFLDEYFKNFGNTRSDYFFWIIQTTLISRQLHKNLHTLLQLLFSLTPHLWLLLVPVVFF